MYGLLRPPNDPDPHARTHTMHNAHHIHDLSPPRLAIGPPRPEPDKDAQRPSFSFLFVLIGSDIAFFIVSWSLLTPSPVPPSARLLARSHVYPYLPGPARVLFSASSPAPSVLRHISSANLTASTHISDSVFLPFFSFFCFTSVIDSESGSPLHFLSTLSQDNGLSFSGFPPPLSFSPFSPLNFAFLFFNFLFSFSCYAYCPHTHCCCLL